MNQTESLKQQAALKAIEYLKYDMTLGVGTGSTVDYFIDALAQHKHMIKEVVSSSNRSTDRLESHQIRVVELNQVSSLDLYIDGADEITQHLMMIKGGGGALTREKVCAAASKQMICIADESKQVDVLGRFPLPVAVIKMARSYVARQLVKLGGQPILREGFLTDNGNFILDVHLLDMTDPVLMEQTINQIPGVVTCGLFAKRPADMAIIAQADGIKCIKQNTSVV